MFRSLLLLTLFLSVNQHAQASHLAGIDITYRCIGTDTIRIFISAYRDCSGIQMPTSGSWGYSETWLPLTPFCTVVPTQITAWTQVTSREVTPLCLNATSRCSDNTSTVKGIEEYTAYADYYFPPGACTEYNFILSQNARNPISTLTTSGSLTAFINIQPFTTPCNNSPQFSVIPVPFLCLGDVFNFSPGAFDLDGDSLVFRLGDCYSGTGTLTPVTYGAGYSALNFISSSTPIVFNPKTGNLTLTPNVIQTAIVCMFVDEYRNGQIIGTVERDIQLTVQNCGPSPVPALDTFDVTKPGVKSAFELGVCANQPLTFDFGVYNRDPARIYTIELKQSFNGPVITIDTAGPNPKAHLVWTPLVPRGVPFSITFVVKDDNCPLNKVASYTYNFTIGPNNLAVQPLTNVLCTEATLSANVLGGTAPFFYEWDGPNGLSSNPDRNKGLLTHVYPDTGCYKFRLRTSDSFGCSRVDSGQVCVTSTGPGSNFSISNAVPCLSDTVVAAYLDNPTGSIFNWDFGANALPNVANGTGPHNVRYLTPGQRTIRLQIDQAGCRLNLQKNVDVSPNPQVDAGADTTVCARNPLVILNGQSTYSSNPGCTYLWSPAVGLDDPTKLNPIARPLVTTDYSLVSICGNCQSNIDKVRIIVNELPVAHIDTARIYACFGQGSASPLPGRGTGGTGPYLYRWTPNTGLSTPNGARPYANPNKNTRYALVVEDAFGCISDSAIVYVDTVEVPLAHAGPDQNYCSGSSGVRLQGRVQNGGFGNYLYFWTPTAGLSNPSIPNPFAAPTNTQIYTLSLINTLTGCVNPTGSIYLDSSSMKVNVVPSPTVNAGPDRTTCGGKSVQLLTQHGGGGILYNHRWSPAAGLSDSTSATPTANPAATTKYFYYVESDGCRSIADSVTVFVVPTATVSLPPRIQICGGDSLLLSPTVGGPAAGPYGFRWVPATGLSNPSIQNPKAYPSITTTYTCFVSANGCESPAGASVQVAILPMPKVIADVTSAPNGLISCTGQPVELQAQILENQPNLGTYTYLWSPTIGLDDPTKLRPMASPPQRTTYTLTATRASCQVSDDVTVTIFPALNPTITAENTALCLGQSTQITATGGTGAATFEWTPAAGLNKTTTAIVTANPQVTTRYKVVVRENGCEDSAFVIIKVSPSPTARFAANTSGGCQGLEVSLRNLSPGVALGSEQYIWDFGDGSPVSNAPNPVHTYRQAGVYRLTLLVKAAGGCGEPASADTLITIAPALSQPFELRPAAPAVLFLPDASIQVRDLNQGSVSWLWQFGDGATATTPSAEHRYQRAGSYRVALSLTDAAGCTYRQQSPELIVQESYIDIPNVFTPNGDGINDVWRITYQSSDRARLAIVDRWGRSLYTSQNLTEGWNGLDLQGNPSPDGVYFYTLELPNNRILKGSFTLLR
jgi:gliding motility-associated-like protein